MPNNKEVLHRIEVKHRTCGTKKRYISPAYELSYDVDLKLHDDHNNKDYHQIHDDGTTVIFREVFVHEKSFYNNPRRGVKERIEKLIQDMYIANGKQNNQRMFVYGEISVLNNLTDKELIELTNRIGEYLTTTYKRPVVLGLHKKRGNNHIHFNIAERELRKGKFLQKRQKIYKDRNGNLILDKNYYDEKGWDIREPIIDESLVPKRADRYARDPETGNYLYQMLESGNRKKWDSDTRQGKFLEGDELSKFHNGIDKVVKKFCDDCGYEISIRRNTPEERSFFQDNDLFDEKIGPRDSQAKNDKFKEKIKRNQERKILRQQFKKENRIKKSYESKLENEIKVASEKTNELEKANSEVASVEIELDNSNQEVTEAKTNLTVWTRNIYYSAIKREYAPLNSFCAGALSELDKLLAYGIQLTKQDIEKLKEKGTLNTEESAKLELWERNLSQVQSLRATLKPFTDSKRYDVELKISIRKRWAQIYNNPSNYEPMIYVVAGLDGLLSFQDGYKLPKNKNPGLLPFSVDINKTIADSLDRLEEYFGKFEYDDKLKPIQNLTNIVTAQYKKIKFDLESEYHLPPDPAIFHVLATIHNNYFQMAAEKEVPSRYISNIVPKHYDPRTAKLEYDKTIAEERSPYTKERRRLNTLQLKNLEILLEKIISVDARIILHQKNEERRKAVFGGKITPKISTLEEIKANLRKQYVDKNNKPTYAKVVQEAERRGLDVTKAVKTRNALKANYRNWHDDAGNLLAISKRDQIAAAKQQKPTGISVERPVEIVQEIKKTQTIKRLEQVTGYFVINEEGRYIHVQATPEKGLSIIPNTGKIPNFHMKWKPKEGAHEKNEMELAEERLYKVMENIIVDVLPVHSSDSETQENSRTI